MCTLRLISGFTCDDGCIISDNFLNDNACDCSSCEDEYRWDCDVCYYGCPTSCGVFTRCNQARLYQINFEIFNKDECKPDSSYSATMEMYFEHDCENIKVNNIPYCLEKYQQQTIELQPSRNETYPRQFTTSAIDTSKYLTFYDYDIGEITHIYLEQNHIGYWGNNHKWCLSQFSFLNNDNRNEWIHCSFEFMQYIPFHAYCGNGEGYTNLKIDVSSKICTTSSNIDGSDIDKNVSNYNDKNKESIKYNTTYDNKFSKSSLGFFAVQFTTANEENCETDDEIQWYFSGTINTYNGSGSDISTNFTTDIQYLNHNGSVDLKKGQTTLKCFNDSNLSQFGYNDNSYTIEKMHIEAGIGNSDEWCIDSIMILMDDIENKWIKCNFSDIKTSIGELIVNFNCINQFDKSKNPLIIDINQAILNNICLYIDDDEIYLELAGPAAALTFNDSFFDSSSGSCLFNLITDNNISSNDSIYKERLYQAQFHTLDYPTCEAGTNMVVFFINNCTFYDEKTGEATNYCSNIGNYGINYNFSWNFNYYHDAYNINGSYDYNNLSINLPIHTTAYTFVPGQQQGKIKTISFIDIDIGNITHMYIGQEEAHKDGWCLDDFSVLIDDINNIWIDCSLKFIQYVSFDSDCSWEEGWLYITLDVSNNSQICQTRSKEEESITNMTDYILTATEDQYHDHDGDINSSQTINATNERNRTYGVEFTTSDAPGCDTVFEESMEWHLIGNCTISPSRVADTIFYRQVHQCPMINDTYIKIGTNIEIPHTKSQSFKSDMIKRGNRILQCFEDIDIGTISQIYIHDRIDSGRWCIDNIKILIDDTTNSWIHCDFRQIMGWLAVDNRDDCNSYGGMNPITIDFTTPLNPCKPIASNNNDEYNLTCPDNYNFADVESTTTTQQEDDFRLITDNTVTQLFNVCVIVVVTVSVLITLLGYIDAKFYRRNELFEWVTIVGCAFYANDFVSDVFFCLKLLALSLDFSLGGHNHYLILFVLSIIFVVVPLLSNIFSLYHYISKWTSDNMLQDTAVPQWLKNNIRILYLVSIICGSSFSGVMLCNSHLFQFEIFSMELPKYYRSIFQSKRFFFIVLLEVELYYMLYL